MKANYEKDLDNISNAADNVKLRLMQKELENETKNRHIVKIEWLFIQWGHHDPSNNFRIDRKPKKADKTSELTAALSRDLENVTH